MVTPFRGYHWRLTGGFYHNTASRASLIFQFFDAGIFPALFSKTRLCVHILSRSDLHDHASN